MVKGSPKATAVPQSGEGQAGSEGDGEGVGGGAVPGEAPALTDWPVLSQALEFRGGVWDAGLTAASPMRNVLKWGKDELEKKKQ